ncbi:AraC family transcriptional regulator [Mycolicibacterium sp. J2]|uniref:AraC family transcriptional regulator n=1 Tax=Mycolicibacterium sp. J2 TaxID=2993511 RepID=UPI00224B8928|nr:AraC family transcriptional regulator [Mycolicibacterium sp. J2]MCX2715354.1 AraC family transcriptional regulator [Mycolicibacterium sp. J2]
MARTAAGAQVMVDLARDHGVSADVALRDTGLTAALLSDPRTQITARQEFSVVTNIVAALGSPEGLGVEAGLRFDLPSYGAFAFAVMSSTTVRSAVDLVLSSLSLTFAFSTVSPRSGPLETRFVFGATDIPAPLRRFVVERDIAGVRCLQREIFPDPPPLAVQFGFPAPRSISRYQEAFGVRPVFDAPESAIITDNDLLDLPLPPANQRIQQLAMAQCDALLNHRQTRIGVSRQVRDLLAASVADPPDARAVAVRLNISDRTLRQRLSAEGTTFRALLEEIREGFAEAFLANGLPVAEVSRRLGYQEVSSFSQAFRRWKGISPRTYRALTLSARPSSNGKSNAHNVFSA